MVAVVVKFTLWPNPTIDSTRWEAERIAEVFNALLRQHGGEDFCRIDCLGESELGEYMGIVYWKTREAAESSMQTYLPLLREMLGYNCQCPLSLELFDVMEPKEIEVDIDVKRFG